ncbi:ribonuclease D [Planctomycetota bacterium]|nr:ribonuclease D [Planctomycetota bacterium]
MSRTSGLYIETTEELQQFMDQARKDGRYGIDLEFIRERTFFPKLALVQIAVGESYRLIDPLSSVSLDPLLETVSDESIVKIVHAGGQDMEILELESKQIPTNIFDTQIAAAFLGLGLQPAYAATCERILGIVVQKGESWTDWLQRPLTENQEIYAIDDVRHLLPLHDHLTKALEKEQRSEWALAEMGKYSTPDFYHPPLSHCLKKVKKAGSLDSRGQGVLGELYLWREQEARDQDRPRRRILSDEIMVEIARRGPRQQEALDKMRGLDGRDSRRYGRSILSSIEKGLGIPESDLVFIHKKRRLEPEEEAALELGAAALRSLCRGERIAPPLAGNNADVEHLIRAHFDKVTDSTDVKLLKGWRGELFGKKIIRFLTGELVLRIDPESGYPRLLES